jgi:hypothetical protein
MEINQEYSRTEHTKNRPRLVERRTGLRGLHIGAAPVPQGVIRKQTVALLNERDPEIPYVKFEAALRSLVCSLIERQDRMNEDLSGRMIELQYRMDDTEADLSQMKAEENSGNAGARP